MIFEKLRLVNFRNYQDTTVSFSSRINVFLGDNGQGKTNLLEAIYILSQGDSFRYADNSILINSQSREAVIQALISTREIKNKLSLHLTKSKKNLSINSNKISFKDVRKFCSSVIFSPESLASIKEGADFRRELVDELLISFDPRKIDLLYDFKKVLKTRNKILKNYTLGIQDKKTTIELLNAINPSYFRLASNLTWSRIQALRDLLKDFNSAMRYISGDQMVDLESKYVISNLDTIEFSHSEIETLLKNRAEELIDAELSGGSSLTGPQKHDIIFLYGQKDSRFYCSQGQQRAIILSFKMAQIVYHRKAHGTYPVLMLDDVLSELDKQKRESLITFLHEINTQIFITTTDLTLPNSFSLDDLSVLSIKDGHVLD